VTKIKPFKAVVYNQEKFKDLSSLVCPPYDVISPLEQQHYHDKNPHNLIRILLGKDIPREDKYRRSREHFRDWLKNKILIQDKTASVYFYSHQYHIKGERKTRLGFISLLHLGDKDQAALGHEHTRLEPKEDRFRLIKQVKANLSPIFVVFLDKKRIIDRIYQKHIQGRPPFVELIDNEKNIHKLWRLDSPDVLEQIEKGMSGEDIFIADGHHRYEVACAYRDKMRQRSRGARITGEENFNYILAYFTNTDPRGLTVLAVHRLLKLDKSLDLAALKLKLKDYFHLEEIKDKARFFFLMEKCGRTEHVLGMYKDKKYVLLRLKNIKILDKLISERPKVYRSLDIAILNTIVLKKILGRDFQDRENIKFSPCVEEFIEEADTDPLTIAFFLNPVKIQQIISVALNGERMPSKSTYFYPKVLSGMVINKFEESNS